jgi:hypothetical protein
VLAKKLGLAGFNLDVEPEKGGEAKLEEYAEFLTTFASRMKAAGLRLSSAEPNGYINTTRPAGPADPWGRYVGNWTGYAPIGHSGAEIQTMDTCATPPLLLLAPRCCCCCCGCCGCCTVLNVLPLPRRLWGSASICERPATGQHCVLEERGPHWQAGNRFWRALFSLG